MPDTLTYILTAAIAAAILGIWVNYPRCVEGEMRRRNGGIKVFLIITLIHLITTAVLASLAAWLVKTL